MSTITPTRIILDCDPGHDDMVAILLALASPQLDVLGITTVGGNATLDHTTENALRVLALAGRPDVPVAVGAAAPLVGPLRTAPHVHGESGMEGPQLPPAASEPIAQDAVAFMVAALESTAAPITLVPTGPLTNVGLLLRERPDLTGRIAHICLMGGSMTEGNITPSAEFNIWVDPEAADLVFRSGVPLTMIGLDVTHQAILFDRERREMAEGGGRASTLVAGLLGFFQEFHRRVYDIDGSAIHDAVAVAHLAHPGLVATIRRNVVIELTGEHTRGRTVVDYRSVTGRPANADVGVGIDRERFVGLLRDALATYD
jgi:pyrimidine-specific ribonucleoside hydrolase